MCIYSELTIITGNAYDELFSNAKSVYAQFLVIQPFQIDPTWQTPSTSIVGSHHLNAINAVSDVDKLFKYDCLLLIRFIFNSI